MNKYLIQYKIATVAELIHPFNARGYSFKSYADSWWNCDAWVVSKVIEANTAVEARMSFHKDLIPQIEQFSVISQCAFRIIANSYFIYKETNNPEKIIYVYYVRDVGHTGLHFDNDEIDQLPKFDKITNKEGLMYIAEAANASTFYTRLSMLLAGAEGLAGEITTVGRVETNKDELKEILGVDLYVKLYGYGKGLRHKLFHGNVKTHQLFDGLTEVIYNKLRKYLKNKYDIQLEESVVHPQRNFNGNYEFAATWKRLRDKKYLDLRLIEQPFDEKNPERHAMEQLLFDDYVETPLNY